jgi:signal peptidase I
MIYKNSFFSKELKQAYIEKDVSTRNQIRFGIFLSLGAFAIYFVMQTLTQSVLYDVATPFMLPSYFSTILLYINFTYICMVVYLLANYQYVTFAEISMNRWYVLVNMKFNPLSMILSKLFARIVSIFFVYSIGFLITLFLTSFLKYPLLIDYMFSMYLAGFIDLVLIATVMITSSLLIKSQETAKYFVFAIACLLFYIKVVSGYYHIISDRALMSNIANLFNFSKSLYLVYIAALFAACLVFTTIYAYKSAHKYNFPFYKKDLDFASDVEIVLKTGKKYKPINKRNFIARMQKTFIDTVVSIVMICVIAALLAFNVLVLAMSLSAPGKEVSFFGTIPYVFESDTMKPELMSNDLVFFKKLAPADTVSVNEIVLYKKDNDTGISRVKAIDDNSITVNIDYYAPNSKPDYMKATITRADISGVYVGRNRWLGAIILFANTVFGRLLFLLVPAFLLFYYKGIIRFFKKVSE